MNNPTTAPSSALDPDFNYERELDRVKARVFLGKHSAFLGSLLAGMDFVWAGEDCPTAATNSLVLWWNPNFFKKSSPKLREATLIHELWHVARLHSVRRNERDPEDWNSACDYRINYDMRQEGFIFENFHELYEPLYKDMSEEEIYEDLQNKPKVSPPPGMMDIVPLNKNQQQQVINKVVTAAHQARMAGAGKLPGDIESMIDKFLNPVVPWEQLLDRFMQDLQDVKYTWARPNRRYTDMYLPSRMDDDGRLEHLIYFCDVSGSISDHDALRFNSEVKHIKDTYNPKRLTLVQFDTQITQVDEFPEDVGFNSLKIVGRGGTDLTCVGEYIAEHQPTAAIIFSDLFCQKMGKPEGDIPIIWVVVNNPKAETDYGRVIHIKG